ncbi:hypothetical protein HID58_096295 [Brassica napus]|uniref:pyruvate decarboxylase n=1 Tax=Brassica napus TaxID=3708 RepID=A0ABQ7X0U0_BRANA|nr:hypothetical protein HID58_096295 [Brassica napus]
MDTIAGSLDTCKPDSGDVVRPNGPVQSTPRTVFTDSSNATLGRHLAHRLVEIGVNDVFSVPGDFNLTLLDHLIAEPGLNLIGCCNELNAGYAGRWLRSLTRRWRLCCHFHRWRTQRDKRYCGSLQRESAVDMYRRRTELKRLWILHHTIGLSDFRQELTCFEAVTCYQAVVNNLEDAHEQIDKAVSMALSESKPVYISISCNLAATPHPTFRSDPKSIIFLVNNGGYTIEVEIHDGPYNVIKNWNYTGFVDAIHNGEGKCWTSKVKCEEELVEAITIASESKKDCLCFIEVILHKDDTSKELLEWGSRVSAANSRPP